MATIYIHNNSPRFVFLLNYKAMSTSMGTLLLEHFPDIEMKYPTTMYLSLDKSLSSWINLQSLYSQIDSFLYKFPRLYKYKKLMGQVHKATLDEIDLETYSIYAIVRNPFSRTVSMFFDKCQDHPRKAIAGERDLMLHRSHSSILKSYYQLKGINSPLVPVDLKCNGNAKYERMCRENLKQLEAIQFEGFCEVLEIILASPDADRHFTPQANLLHKDGELIPEHVFKMENIEEEWMRLCQMLGRKMPLQQRNKTKHRHYRDYYNTNSRNIIAKLYTKDLEAFKYQF